MDPNGLLVGHIRLEQKTRAVDQIRYSGTHSVIFHADRFVAVGNSLVTFTIHPPLRRIRVAIGNDLIERDPVKQIFWPWTTGNGEPRRANKLPDEGKPGMRRQEDVAFRD